VTTGAWIHDDVSRHVGACVPCQSTDAENVRVAQPKALRQTVPTELLAKMWTSDLSSLPPLARGA
jgi:hypothetical protein